MGIDRRVWDEQSSTARQQPLDEPIDPKESLWDSLFGEDPAADERKEDGL